MDTSTVKTTLSSEEEYFWKLDNILVASCAHLRTLFEKRWNAETGAIWQYIEEQGQELISILNKHVRDQQKEIISNGNLNDWDMTIISMVLQNFPSNASSKYHLETKSVQTLKNLRNKLAHHSSNKLTLGDYNDKLSTISSALSSISVAQSEIQKIIDQAGVKSIRLAEEALMKRILSADKYVKAGKFEKAIAIYLEATTIPNLLYSHVSTCYAYRADCYLKISEKHQDWENYCDQALRDATLALENNDRSWNAYYISGQCRHKKNNLTEAISYYNQALAICPGQKHIKNELDGCRFSAGCHSRQDHMNPLIMPLNLLEEVKKYNDSNGLNLTNEEFINLQLFYRRAFPGAVDVYRGHQSYFGWLVPQDFKLAVKRYQKAGTVGNPNGMYHLASCLMHGTGVKQNVSKAVEYLRMAATMSTGIQVKVDSTMLKKSLGVTSAQQALGLAYQTGVGVEQDVRKAVKWYEKAALNGHPHAANNLGLIYSEGHQFIPKDEKMAAMYWKLGIYLKSSNSAVLLMDYYLDNLEPELAAGAFNSAKHLGYHKLMYETEQQFRNSFQFCCCFESRQESEEKVEDFELSHNLTEKGLTFKERLYRAKSDEHVKEAKLAEMFEEIMKSRLGTQESYEFGGKYLPKIAIADPFGVRQIYDKATQGSKTAISHLLTYFYSDELYKAVQKSEPFGDKEKTFIVNMLYNCRILEWHALRHPHDGVTLLMKIIEELFHDKCDLKGDDDEKIRLCYVTLNLGGSMSTPNSLDTKLLIEGCKRYPNNCHYYDLLTNLYGNKRQHNKGLFVANEGVSRFPDHVDLIYAKAKHTQSLRCKSKKFCAENAALPIYEEFLAKAPIDHRHRPQAYYGMGMSLTNTPDPDIEKIREYYELGLKAETYQLPCYLPYSSSWDKKGLEIFVLADDIKQNKNRYKKRERDIKHILEQKPYLKNPMRTVLIVQQREELKGVCKFSKKNFHIISKTTFPPKNVPTLPQRLFDFKQIRILEMVFGIDKVYENRLIDLTVIDDPILGHYNSIQIIAEDDNGDVIRVSVSVEQNEDNKRKFAFGCRFSVLNPYLRVGGEDGVSAIRIDEEKCIIHLDKVNEMCRFCGNGEATKTCGKCKRAKYCDHQCQMEDWKRKHKFICVQAS